MDKNRREFLRLAGYAVGMAVMMPLWVRVAGAMEVMGKMVLSDDAWKKKLTPGQYAVLREHGTERAFSSPLEKEKRAGIFTCAGCGLELYDSAAKFESGTGWPSFYKPIRPEAVGTSVDKSWFSTRTEVHCARCEGHLGHVFPDGPQPTGLRYCMNGVAMGFKPR